MQHVQQTKQTAFCSDCSEVMHGVSCISHLDILHDHVYVIRCLDDFIQANYVWVHEKPQDLDLSAHCSPEAQM